MSTTSPLKRSGCRGLARPTHVAELCWGVGRGSRPFTPRGSGPWRGDGGAQRATPHVQAGTRPPGFLSAGVTWPSRMQGEGWGHKEKTPGGAGQGPPSRNCPPASQKTRTRRTSYAGTRPTSRCPAEWEPRARTTRGCWRTTGSRASVGTNAEPLGGARGQPAQEGCPQETAPTEDKLTIQTHKPRGTRPTATGKRTQPTAVPWAPELVGFTQTPLCR